MTNTVDTHLNDLITKKDLKFMHSKMSSQFLDTNPVLFSMPAFYTSYETITND